MFSTLCVDRESGSRWKAQKKQIAKILVKLAQCFSFSPSYLPTSICNEVVSLRIPNVVSFSGPDRLRWGAKRLC